METSCDAATKRVAPVLFFQVDAQSSDGLTALGFAAAAGHLNIVTLLSQHTAKVSVYLSDRLCVSL